MTALIAAGATVTATSVTASAVTTSDWPAYLGGQAHSSYNATQTTVTPANAATLVRKWQFAGDRPTVAGQPAATFISSPVVADGAVFIGTNAGWFYKLDETTGAVLAKVFIGYRPRLTCSAAGFAATATVAADPSDGQDTVYVAAPNGYLYAFRAANLGVRWRSAIAYPSATVSDFYDWSSPTVANGKIYVGVSSECDNPLVRGGVVGFDQATGHRFALFSTVSNGTLGGSVWSSVAVDTDGYVYATTGNPQDGASQLHYSESIVKLDGATLKPVASFTVPEAERTADGDFGGSPTIFGPDVGACNKNGRYYALNRSTMQLVWEQRMGAASKSSTPAQCSSAAVYDGKYLYFAGPAATIKGVAYRGTIRRINPVTGNFLWQTGLPNGVIGPASMDGGGVIAVGTYDNSATPNATYLVNAANGAMLRTLVPGADFAQTAFADGWLFAAEGTSLSAWGP